MLKIRPVASLYHAEGGWFSANWHFSFDQYRDPDHMGFGSLRVFNDDRLAPGAVWPMHPHRDVEGITYVAEGMFEHADSLGNDGVLPPGGVQRMTLGSGAQHSERNHSKTEPLRFIQMWILPARRGLPPSVEQRAYAADERRDRMLPVLVPAEGYGGAGAPRADGAVRVHRDAALYAGLLGPRVVVSQRIRPGFGAYLFVVHGVAAVSTAGGHGPLEEGAAAMIAEESEATINAGAAGAEVLLVEVELT